MRSVTRSELPYHCQSAFETESENDDVLFADAEMTNAEIPWRCLWRLLALALSLGLVLGEMASLSLELWAETG